MIVADDLWSVVSEIWQTTLGLVVEIQPDGPLQQCAREMCASVLIAGSWDGAVIVECGAGTASVFARAMLGPDGLDPSEAEVHDVVGELTNMVGGKVKATIAGDSTLSLPTVVAGDGLELRVPGASRLLAAPFIAEGAPFSVVVMGRANGRDGATR